MRFVPEHESATPLTAAEHFGAARRAAEEERLATVENRRLLAEQARREQGAPNPPPKKKTDRERVQTAVIGVYPGAVTGECLLREIDRAIEAAVAPLREEIAALKSDLAFTKKNSQAPKRARAPRTSKGPQ